MSKTILLPGAFDTKGLEYKFVKEQIEALGFSVLTMNWGVLGGTDLFPVHIQNDEVARAGGGVLQDMQKEKDQKKAMEVMGKGVLALTRRLFEEGRIQGVLGLGRVRGTRIITAAMRALPLGVPKVMISTVAAGDTSVFVGFKDVLMFPSIVDISGLNRISREVFRRAAGAVCGMAGMKEENIPRNPVVSITLFGQTKPCVDRCRQALEKAGYEVLVFHATGTGGKTMEAMVDEGHIQAVLDITPTEIADALFGGIFSAGMERLEAPGRAGIPHLIAPGCVDMVNYGPRSTVPEGYRNRQLFESKADVTLMRTDVEENIQMGRLFAEKANRARGRVVFLLPLKGFSRFDQEGGVFWSPEADRAFIAALRNNLTKSIPVYEMDCHINDERFAAKATELLLKIIEE